MHVRKARTHEPRNETVYIGAYMIKRTVLYFVPLVMLALIIGSTSFFAGSPVNKASFRDDMRTLWQDHVTWTRLYIVSAVADLPDKGPARDRLLKNQTDIGNAVKPYFGEDTGEKLTSLLKEHISIAAEVVSAAKVKDKVKQDAATKKWYTNADEIAVFLSGANPKYWPVAEMKSMMRQHLDLTTAEVVARLSSDWSADIAAYEAVNAHILKMADMLSDGIIHQYPKNFPL